MSGKSLEKHLAEIFESELREFLSLPLLERLAKAKRFLQYEDKKLSQAIEKYSSFVEQDIEGMTEEQKENYFQTSDMRLREYLSMAYQDIFFNLPYFLLASHHIFDKNYSGLTYEAKQELRKECDLNTKTKRRDACLNFFNRFIYEKVVDGGSESHWNKWTRLYFLSQYEKFSAVIENSRNDIKSMKEKKVAVMDMKKEICEKYHIPEHLWFEVSKQTNRKDKLARKWAVEKIQNDLNKELLEKMGFADSYLIKVLQEARTEAAKSIPCGCRNYDNHKLIFLVLGDPNLVQYNCILSNPRLEDLKFDSFIKKEHYGMSLYFTK
ncbi:MAG TPA: hypothetical protein VF556_16820 [Pyrinomonadaceae bacterium]|jgi:hypothetical protein